MRGYHTRSYTMLTRPLAVISSASVLVVNGMLFAVIRSCQRADTKF